MIYWNQNDVDFVGVKREREMEKKEKGKERERYSINIDEAKWCWYSTPAYTRAHNINIV